MKPHKLFLLLAVFVFLLQIMEASGLRPYQWQNRVVVYCIDAESDLERFAKHVSERNHEFQERDIVLLAVGQMAVDSELSGQIGYDDSRELRKGLGGDFNAPWFALIGKDGGVKRTVEGAFPVEEMWQLIDGMPMRRAEMRKQ